MPELILVDLIYTWRNPVHALPWSSTAASVQQVERPKQREGKMMGIYFCSLHLPSFRHYQIHLPFSSAVAQLKGKLKHKNVPRGCISKAATAKRKQSVIIIIQIAPKGHFVCLGDVMLHLHFTMYLSYRKELNSLVLHSWTKIKQFL